MDEDFSEALTNLIKEQITHHNEVRIEKVGTFRLDHRNPCQQQFQDGRVVMMPPKNQIRFIPDKNHGD